MKKRFRDIFDIKGERTSDTMITIRYGSRSVCMGDDVNNGIYTIEMPDEATLGDLMRVVMHGGDGNTRPIPTTSTTWQIYTNIGMVAEIMPEKKEIHYIDHDEKASLYSSGIIWVYGCHEEYDVDIAMIEKSYFI